MFFPLLYIGFVFKTDSKEEEDACGSQPKGLQKTDLYHLQKVRYLFFPSSCIRMVRCSIWSRPALPECLHFHFFTSQPVTLQLIKETYWCHINYETGLVFCACWRMRRQRSIAGDLEEPSYSSREIEVLFGVLSLINEKKIISGPEDKNRKISRQPQDRKGGFREYGRERELKSVRRLWPACKRKRSKYVRCNTQKDRPSQTAGRFFSDWMLGMLQRKPHYPNGKEPSLTRSATQPGPWPVWEDRRSLHLEADPFCTALLFVSLSS